MARRNSSRLKAGEEGCLQKLTVGQKSGKTMYKQAIAMLNFEAAVGLDKSNQTGVLMWEWFI